MKVLFLTILVVAAAFGKAVENVAPIEGPDPPIEDPLIRPDEIAIDISLDPLAQFLEGSVMKELVAEGLSTLRYSVDINVLLLTAYFEVDLVEAKGNASYAAEGYIDARPLRDVTLPSGNFTGNDQAKIAAKTVKVKGNASIFINIRGKVQLSRLALNEVSFAELSIDFGPNFSIGGRTIDWDAHNQNIKQNFDQDFAQFNSQIADKLRGVANDFLGEYTLQELICLISGGTPEECLGL